MRLKSSLLIKVLWTFHLLSLKMWWYFKWEVLLINVWCCNNCVMLFYQGELNVYCQEDSLLWSNPINVLVLWTKYSLVYQSLHAFVVRVTSTDYYVLGKYDLTHSVIRWLALWCTLSRSCISYHFHEIMYFSHGLEDISYEIYKVTNVLCSDS